MSKQSMGCRYRWLLGRDVGWAEVADVWHSVGTVFKGGKGGGMEEGAVVGEIRHGGVLQNHCWGMEWDVQGERGQMVGADGRWDAILRRSGDDRWDAVLASDDDR